MALAYAGSTGTNAPPSRLLTPDLTECWRSAPGVFATWIEIRLPEPGEIDTVALVGTNLRPTASGRLRIGVGDIADPDNTTHDSGDRALGVVDPWGLAVWCLDMPVLGDVIRIDLEDLGVDENALEVPRVWVTKAWRPDRWYDFGYQQTVSDLSQVSRSRYSGAVFSDERPIVRGYRLDFKVMSEADRNEARRLHRLCGSSREMLLCLDEQSPALGEDTLLVMPTGQPIAHDNPRSWSWTLECEERL
ncbi:MAG TPA: hypothetical protein VNS22_01945 [Geminicoccus sp.]|uniref:hypothetical protein n=1 Tax=Geminicoccus sp. TaxID=2024832 RepID=UPI002C7BE0E6|nr:hypothetical protein [Geminicoccus sp.]HWL67125.1 hypothetical protein [Geminicoccus sp.]